MHFVFIATLLKNAIFYHLSYLCFLTCKHPQTDDGYPVSETCLFIMAMLVCEMVVRQNIAYKIYLLKHNRVY